MTPQPRPVSAISPVWMDIGSFVTLLPVDVATGLIPGEITHWLSGPAGLVATIGVSTSAEDAETCAGHRLWLSGREAVHNELIVFEVIARKPSRFVNTTLALTGVLPVAHEHRRDSVRAASRHPVTVTFDDGTIAQGVATDISRGGCLIALNKTGQLRPVGTLARIDIDLPGTGTFVLAGEVVRSVVVTGEIALRFAVTDIDLTPIDRLVYATVARAKVAGEAAG
jgi:hypothetical protein